jgi:hypothetical protein
MACAVAAATQCTAFFANLQKSPLKIRGAPEQDNRVIVRSLSTHGTIAAVWFAY